MSVKPGVRLRAEPIASRCDTFSPATLNSDVYGVRKQRYGFKEERSLCCRVVILVLESDSYGVTCAAHRKDTPPSVRTVVGGDGRSRASRNSRCSTPCRARNSVTTVEQQSNGSVKTA
jgi:hypothetical protein